jgi:hypothetical protein
MFDATIKLSIQSRVPFAFSLAARCHFKKYFDKEAKSLHVPTLFKIIFCFVLFVKHTLNKYCPPRQNVKNLQ